MTTPVPKVQNSTFQDGGRTEFNACVGINGHPDLEEYADGFLEASKSLLQEIVGNKNTIKNDTWVYPIIFNARHGLELVLKGVLQRLPHIRNSVFIDLRAIKTHDIAALWNEIEIKSVQIDRRYKPIIDTLSPHVKDYSEIDPTAETFRYPRDQEQNIHLEKTPLINLGIFYVRFNELTDLLEQLSHLTKQLQDEYSLGTFTTHLSRKDLEEISKKLPKRQQWGDVRFTQISVDIQNEFGIGKRQYSAGLKIIEGHPTFSSAIGINVSLGHAKLQHLETFINEWIALHPKRNTENDLGHDYIEDAEARFEGYQQEAEARRKALTALETLPSLVLAEIGALYQLGKDRSYCEHYPFYLKNTSTEIGNANDKAAIHSFIYHYLTKTNFLDSVKNGLKIMGQQAIAAALPQQ